MIDGSEHRELRIAPVMTGGTSLAVWMGGATTELYRLLRSRADVAEAEIAPVPCLRGDGGDGPRVYAWLCRLTGTTPVVDVITGTSAGGLNGTLLAAAVALDVTASEFASIRDTWLDVADLELLLRSPRELDPPSLLKGDEAFVPPVQAKLEQWRRAHPRPSADVDLVVTVTTVRPEPTSRTDHFGEEVHEVNHAQTLHFTTGHLRKHPDWPRRMAIAARTSASIPGVFEPSYLPVGEADALASHRPDMDDHASFRESRWAVDGGVVVNLPLTEALDRIFDQPATQDVRRVILYVSPTPSGKRDLPADGAILPPKLAQSLATAVTAPRAEGIAKDIDDITLNNRRVLRQQHIRQVVRPYLSLLTRPGGAPDMFALYRRRRATTSVEAVLDRLERHHARPLPIPREQLDQAVVDERLALLPETLDDGTGEDDWRWGIAPVEQAASITLSLIDRAYTLTATEHHDARAALARARSEVHAARTDTRRVRRRDDDYWPERFASFPPVTTLAEARAWARDSYAAWPGVTDEDADGPPPRNRLQRAHRRIAAALVAVRPTIQALTADAPDDDVNGLLNQSAPGAIAAELRAILPEATTAEAPDQVIDHAQRRLLAVHVAQVLLLIDVLDREQRVELMQLSWNSRNGLDRGRTPHEKLAGPELARLGAFLKGSWRANDWFWGRMDAAHRLVMLMLDPARLRQLDVTGEELLAQLDAIFAGQVPDDVRAEVEGLADPARTSLPATATALATIVQSAIAQEELDEVKRMVDLALDGGGPDSDAGRFRLAVERAPRTEAGVIEREAVGELVRKLRIGSETVRGEVGFGPMNRVSAHASSVLVNLATGKASGIPVAPRLLRPLRVPLQAVSSLARILNGRDPLARALTVLVLAVAGAIVAVRLAGASVPAVAVAVAATLLIGTVSVAMMRSGFLWLALCFAAGAAFVSLALLGPDLRGIVYSQGVTTAARSVRPGTEIEVTEGGHLRIRSDVSDRAIITDVPVDDGTRLELREATARVLRRNTTPQVAVWKRWGFTAPVSVARVLLLGAAALVARDALRRRSRSRAETIGAASAGLLLLGAAWAVRGIATRGLTGRDPGDHDPGGVKHWLVLRAEALHGYRMGVVLLVLVGASILIAMGVDVVVTTHLAQVRAWVSERRARRA